MLLRQNMYLMYVYIHNFVFRHKIFTILQILIFKIENACMVTNVFANLIKQNPCNVGYWRPPKDSAFCKNFRYVYSQGPQYPHTNFWGIVDPT